MGKIVFFPYNKWRDGTVTASTEHVNFPATRTQNRLFIDPWQSEHGPGSGWGRFIITAGVNDKIDFEETAATPLVATLTAGTYDVDSLCLEIKAQLEAAGASTYTVTYIETGTGINKFSLESDGLGGGNIFTLLWNTGANTATSAADSIGFDDSADDSGALQYTADYIRIHTTEYIQARFSAAQSINGVFLKGHNFQDGSTVIIQMSNDNFVTVPVSLSFTWQAGITGLYWATAYSYKDFRILITDVDNPDGYIEIGTIGLCTAFAPSLNFHYERDRPAFDPSLKKISTGGQRSNILKTKYSQYSYFFDKSDELAAYDAMWEEVGNVGDLFYVEDSDYVLTTMRFVEMPIYERRHHQGAFWFIRIVMEELR